MERVCGNRAGRDTTVWTRVARRGARTAVLALASGLPVSGAAAQTDGDTLAASAGRPALPASGATGAWIGAIAGGLTTTGLLTAYHFSGCDDDGCLTLRSFGIAALIGGTAGAFVGQVVGTGIGTYADWRPAGWAQGGAVWGTSGSDPGQRGTGFRAGLLARMTPIFSGGFEYARFSSPRRTERALCLPGCQPPGESVVVTGTLTSLALVERADLRVAGPVGAHLVLGLGLAWQSSTWAFPGGDPPPGQVAPDNPSEIGVHLSAGGGLDVKLTSRLLATGELRLEPSWGWQSWSASLGLAYR